MCTQHTRMYKIIRSYLFMDLVISKSITNYNIIIKFRCLTTFLKKLSLHASLIFSFESLMFYFFPFFMLKIFGVM